MFTAELNIYIYIVIIFQLKDAKAWINFFFYDICEHYVYDFNATDVSNDVKKNESMLLHLSDGIL